MKKLWTGMTLALLLGAHPGWTQTAPIVLDAEKADKVGAWTLSKQSSPADNYYWLSTTANPEPTGVATFPLKSVPPGRYDLAIKYRNGPMRSPEAPWTISDKTKVTTNLINQKNGGSDWVPLAQNVEFDGSDKCFVALRNSTGATGTVVVIQSLYIVPAGSPLADGVRLPAAPAASAPPAEDGPCKLTVNVQGPGQVLRSPDRSGYKPNTHVALTAQASSGYVFAGWQMENQGATNLFWNPLKFLVQSNHTLKAVFLPAPVGVILDNPQAEFAGKWDVSVKSWPGTRYEDYSFTSTESGAGNSSATYRPNLPQAGKYDVYIWYSAGQNRSKQARWEICGKGEPKTILVNQQSHGNQWYNIGSGIEFDRGTAGCVRVHSGANLPDNEPKGTVVVADAVALVRIAP